jgi:hypothetical protein
VFIAAAIAKGFDFKRYSNGPNCIFNMSNKSISLYVDYKEEFFMKCNFFDKGMPRFRSDGSSFKTKAPLYEIENKELNAVFTEEDVRKIGL